jgi:hypothetical protein
MQKEKRSMDADQLARTLTEEQKPRMRAWIQALHSGEYLQTRSRLRAPLIDESNARNTAVLGYCCLGVAAELAIQAGCPIHWKDNNIVSNATRQFMNEPAEPLEESSTLLIPTLTDWYGLSGRYATIHVPCHLLHPDRANQRCDVFYEEGHNASTCTRTVRIGATDLNDTFRWDFHQIADAFEAFYFPAEVTGE